MSISLTEPLTLFKFVKTYTNLHEGDHPAFTDVQTARLTAAFDQFATALRQPGYTPRSKAERYNYEKALFLTMADNNIYSYYQRYGSGPDTGRNLQAMGEACRKLADKFSNGDSNRFMAASFKNGELLGRLARIEHGYYGNYAPQVLKESIDNLKQALNTTLIEMLPSVQKSYSVTNIADAFYAMRSGGDQFLGIDSAIRSLARGLESQGSVVNESGTYDKIFYGDQVLATLAVQQLGTSTEKAAISSVPPEFGATMDKPLANFESYLSYPVHLQGDVKQPTQDDAVFLLKAVQELYSRLSTDQTHDNRRILPSIELFKMDLESLYVTNLEGYRNVYRHRETVNDNTYQIGM